MRSSLMARSLGLVALLLPSAALAQPALGPEQPLTPERLAEGQRQAAAAAGADRFLLVWQAGIGGASAIRGARVGLDGVSLDPAGFDVARAPGGQFEPAVAFGHGVFLVVYSDMQGGDHALRARRVTPKGEVLDASGVALSTEPTTARMGSVAATSDGFVAAWCQAEPTGHGFVVRARRLGPDGQPQDAEPLPITDVPPWSEGEDFGHAVLREAICQHMQIAVQGERAMMVWGGTVNREQGYFINRAGLNLTTGEVSPKPARAVAGAQSRIFNPALAPLGTGFVFAWTDPRGRGETGLAKQNFGLLSVDGQPSYGSLNQTPGARIVLSPAVASSGVVAFIDPFENPARNRRFEWRLKLRRVQADTLSPGDDVLVTDNAGWPTLAARDGGPTLLGYTRLNAAEGSGSLRIRLVTP